VVLLDYAALAAAAKHAFRGHREHLFTRGKAVLNRPLEDPAFRPGGERLAQYGLMALVALGISLAALSTYVNVTHDRGVTEQSAYRLTRSLAESIDHHVEATLRDAGNAVTAAALLVERSGGLQAFTAPGRLQDELRRELTDNKSTARLVALDATGRLVAQSSGMAGTGSAALADASFQWHVRNPTDTQLRLGLPQRSAIGGEMILPYSRTIIAPDRSFGGVISGEVRITHFVNLYNSITSLHSGAILVMTNDGVVLMHAPLDERTLGTRGTRTDEFLAQAIGNMGDLAFTPARDGIPRLFSWRRMSEHPLMVVVGLETAAVLAPWHSRTQTRVTLVGLACALVLLLATALALYLRRLEQSRIALQASESRFWAAMENDTIGVAVLGLDGQWLRVNRTICTMLGYTREELLAIPSASLTARQDRPDRASLLVQLSQGQLQAVDQEKRMIHKDGHEVLMQVHTMVLRDAAGQPTHLMSHAQDITERKRAEARIHELNQTLERRVAERTVELTRANQDLEAFSYSAAHDLRGPLERLSMFVDVLARELDGAQPTVARRLDSIKRQATQMTALVTDLLALAQTSRKPLRPVAVPLNLAVQEALEQLAPQTEGRRIEWVIANLPTVRADHGLLREALVNLLGNALKYSRGRDPAVIEVGNEPAAQPGEAVIFIRDNGAGFDMNYVGDIFVAFRRLHSVSDFEGSGIGLAIVHRIIERSGGRIWAEGVPNQGAVFRIALPAVAE